MHADGCDLLPLLGVALLFNLVRELRGERAPMLGSPSSFRLYVALRSLDGAAPLRVSSFRPAFPRFVVPDILLQPVWRPNGVSHEARCWDEGEFTSPFSSFPSRNLSIPFELSLGVSRAQYLGKAAKLKHRCEADVSIAARWALPRSSKSCNVDSCCCWKG